MVENELAKEIEAKIAAEFEQVELYVLDPNEDGQHLQALVISPEFNGLSLVAQHQKVMGALHETFASRLHALSLKTFTPEKWAQQKSQYL